MEIKRSELIGVLKRLLRPAEDEKIEADDPNASIMGRWGINVNSNIIVVVDGKIVSVTLFDADDALTWEVEREFESAIGFIRNPVDFPNW